MGVRLGINPLTWSNDDLPRLGSDITLDTCLAEAAAAGYAGVELGRKFPRDAALLGPLLEEHGLALVSGWYSLRLLERDAATEFAAMQDHFNLLRALGCEVMVCAEVTGCVHGDPIAPLSTRPVIAPGDWPRFGKRMGQLAQRMRESGMRLAYHHHMGTVVQSEQDIEALMHHVPDEVDLLLDTGHLTYAGGDPVAVARQFASRIAHVHCKDIRPAVLADARNRDRPFLAAVVDGVFTVPGDGCVDYPSVLAPLRHSRYRGWLVVEAEQDPAVADPVTYAELGARNLESLAAGWPD